MSKRDARHDSSSLARYFARILFGAGSLRLIEAGLAFGTGIILARTLGAAQYGVYAVAMAIFAFVSVPMQFGIPQVLTRDVASSVARHNLPSATCSIRLGRQMIVGLSVGTLLIALLLLSIGWLPAEIDFSMLLAITIFGLLVSHLRVSEAALRGFGEIVIGQTGSLLVRPLLVLGMLAAVVYWPLKVGIAAEEVVWLNAIAALGAAALFRVYLAKKIVPASRTHFTKEEIQSFFRSSLPMALTEGARIIQAQLPILIMGYVASFSATGSFRIAVSIATICSLPVALLNVSVAPAFSAHYARRRIDELRILSKWAAALMFSTIAVICAPLFLAGEALIGIIFGNEYLDAVLPLHILCAGQLASAAFGSNASLLNMTGNEKIVSAAFIGSLLASVALSLFLIPAYGAIGAAIATSSCIILWNGALWIAALQRLEVDTSILAFLTSNKQTN